MTNTNLDITYEFFSERTKTGKETYGHTIFVYAIKNRKTLKIIEFYGLRKTENNGTFVISPNSLKMPFEFEGELIEISKNEVKALVSQVDNKTIFSQTYTN